MSKSPAPAWMNSVKAPLLLIAGDGATVVALNTAALRLFETLLVPATPCTLGQLIGVEAAAGFDLSTEGQAGPVVLAARIGGKTRTLALEAAPVEDPPGHWVVTVHDRITEMEAGIYVSTIYEDLQAILEWLPVGVEIFDATGNSVFTNVHGSRLFGWGPDELNDIEEWWLHAYPDPEYRELAKRTWAEAIATSRAEGSAVLLSDWMVTCKDGSQKLAHFRFRYVGDHHVLAYWDVSEQRQMEAELRHHAETDVLTGLRNRRRFFTDATAALATREEPISVLMMDLDHFKSINDRFGHAGGDAVLREVADRFRRALRETDVLARLGGEEFVALLPGADRAQAELVAEQLRHFISASPLEAAGTRMMLTVSIGVATRGRSDDIDALLARADRGLYAAKRHGRNRVCFEASGGDHSGRGVAPVRKSAQAASAAFPLRK